MSKDPRPRGSVVDPGETQPLEYQRYGPAAGSPPPAAGWHAAPAWSSRPSISAAPATVRRGPSLLTIVAVALVVGLASGGFSALAVADLIRPQSGGAAIAGAAASGAAAAVRIDESSAVISAVQKVAPSVVTIVTQSNGLFGSGQGSGSGFIFDANGWILTNKHVVSGADTLRVVLNDTRTFDARVAGTDTLTDLAILKIDGTGLPVAPLGSSAALRPGQVAIAIGNPLGDYQNTVTSGVISGLGRQIPAGSTSQTSGDQLNNLIQTDAAINPGNSGGPLLNSGGQVIGINTAVATSAQGIGFAIPIDVAKPILRLAVAGKKIARPWVGVHYQPVTKALATEKDLPVDYGALVARAASGNDPAVVPGSPAARAGLQEGDVLVALDGVRIDASHDLSLLILPHAPGDDVTLRVLRQSTARDVDVTLGELP
ncbi:MAG: trypsin-like peptidase domain-containing protein [Chloroflexota bacterium]|nr:trypsin-like peptidase domain-containing protein [Chloroflexota bacterium]